MEIILLILSLIFLFFYDFFAGIFALLIAVVCYTLGVFAKKAKKSLIFFLLILDFSLLLLNKIIGIVGALFLILRVTSYILDVKNGKYESEKSFVSILLYICYFPYFLMGPIVGYDYFKREIHKKHCINFDLIIEGISRIMLGVFKKVVIAVRIHEYTKGVVLGEGGIIILPMLLLYSIELYADFSGGIDIAIGTSKMFDINLLENFNKPYLAKNLTEFWTRWHITMALFFKEYVYYPLSTSKSLRKIVKGKDMKERITKVINLSLLITWALTGLWHGASWNFVIWGLFNFAFIILERILGFEKWKIPGFIKHIYALTVLLFSWVWFRAENIYHLREIVLDMFMANDNVFINDTTIWLIKEYGWIYLIGIIFAMPVFPALQKLFESSEAVLVRGFVKLTYIALLGSGIVLAVMTLIRGGYNPFIYFNF